MKVGSRRTLSFAAAVCAVIAIALYFPLHQATTPTTNVKPYPAVIAKLKQTDSGAAHFPDQIPASASSATFFYQPGFLQGALMLRLRLKLPPSKVTEIERKLRAQHSPLTAEEMHRLSPSGIPPEGMQVQEDRSGPIAKGFEPMPTDFTSYLIGIDLETARTNWNHPRNGGISVSTSRNEVVYWVN